MNPHDFALPEFTLRNRAPRRRALISLTPLIDVVFILLIFFMLASSFLDWRSITLNAPAQAAAGTGIEGALLVEVLGDGTLRLSGEALAPAALGDRLAARFAAKPDQRVLVKPSAGVPLQQAVTVLGAIVRAGGANVSMMRDR